ncbi:NADH:ubiquinone oxidoreductase subunit L [Fictibacillus macauensis ZFHKF-1]|uniref:NADH:ubiquinone oxidoreductase subunit L n=1 Tax=Fictibacillus macauensis ZFHKF-1 TaxID=1196324 RepID=I8UAE5_9BACL|nr:NADH-quinone oxidoreductase subunit L [Fictibacillus macauensis]EIT83783.1 NADH:ubiquinone oxidoreductase subunit L [Fictibacillus macauensis ZFHKF-1]
MVHYAFMIPLFPLLSFLLHLLFRKRVRSIAPILGCICTLVPLVLSVGVLIARFQGTTYTKEIEWLSLGKTAITMGVVITPLNAMMLVIVSLVSFLVHVYSKEYMKDSERLGTYYSYLGLFTFAMLGLVMSVNVVQLYIFWELVGVGSFLLIGFHYTSLAARAAAKKAFIMTRIGDVGLLIGIILLYWKTGSFSFAAIFQSVASGGISQEMITVTALLIFVGAIGKSGQLPLHTWLPDAMEGPTPVSALIHAATMVAAGVYLVAIMYPLFLASSVAMTTVAVIGGITAIFAASIGLVQDDLKRVLAYSTVSQLGYMMLALGSGGYDAGVFHLMTHAFFKALLFLAAGSVIHAVHTQNIREMGGLWNKLKFTGPLFVVGALSLSGFPLFAGFFSKDAIFAAVYHDGRYVLFFIALLTAFLTSLYMFRLVFLVFFGPAAEKIYRENSIILLAPMVVLGILAVVAGYIGSSWFGAPLQRFLHDGTTSLPLEAHGPVWLPYVAILISLAGIGVAYVRYGRRKDFHHENTSSSPVTMLLKNKYYVDEVYGVIFVKGAAFIGTIFVFVERYIIEGMVGTLASTVQWLAKCGSAFQNGQVQRYGAVAITGLALMLLLFIVLTGGYLQ